MSLADLMVGLINIPFLAATDFSHRWIFGEVFCKIRLAWVYVNTFVPVTTIVLLTGFHRLRASRNHRYRNMVKTNHVRYAMVACWVSEAVFDLFVAFGFPVVTKKTFIQYDAFCDMEFLYTSPGFTIFFVILKFVLPFIFLFAFCISLLVAIIKMSKRVNSRLSAARLRMSAMPLRMANHRSCADNSRLDGAGQSKVSAFRKKRAPLNIQSRMSLFMNGVFHGQQMSTNDRDHENKPNTSKSSCVNPSNSSQPPATGQRSGVATVSGSHGLQDRSSPTRVAETSRKTPVLSGHRRSAAMLFILIGTFLLFWTPVVITTLVWMACPARVSVITVYWVYLAVYCNSLVNPFLYAVTNRRYRMGIAKILRLARWRN